MFQRLVTPTILGMQKLHTFLHFWFISNDKSWGGGDSTREWGVVNTQYQYQYQYQTLSKYNKCNDVLNNVIKLEKAILELA